ncbi:MAG: flippase-like domain-containing protein [Chloroflexaceae bacterium]|nr:flippase-like domain-containing protein [Chloroflexaceae bacterium]
MRGQHWRLIISGIISLIILLVAFLNREELFKALETASHADPLWLIIALITILLSYLISSQVLQVVLVSLGYRLGIMRLWATTLVAIVISQSVPAGGVGSYAFFASIISRRGVPTGQATLVASLEMISYICAMLITFGFSLIFMTAHQLATGGASLLAAFVALFVISGVFFILTRREEQLTHWLVSIHNLVAHWFRRDWDDSWARRLVNELSNGRKLVASRRRDVALLVLIQLLALCGHSLAMLMVFHSLQIETTFPVMMTAFGVALVTSTFNVLPGGGGTVETALVAVLSQMGLGAMAVPGAIIFRLLNFWLLIPVATVCYYWLMHEPPPAPQSNDSESSDSTVGDFSTKA